jgi:sRNA-binding protein
MNNDQILSLLCEHFPRTFARNPAERPPLKREIDRDLVARLDGMVSRSALKRALGAYVSCPEYRAKLIEGAARIDLDGNAAGVVTADEAEHALELRPVKIKPTAPPAAPAPPPKPKRLSLEDLRMAARQRRGLA